MKHGTWVGYYTMITHTYDRYDEAKADRQSDEAVTSAAVRTEN